MPATKRDLATREQAGLEEESAGNAPLAFLESLDDNEARRFVRKVNCCFYFDKAGDYAVGRDYERLRRSMEGYGFRMSLDFKEDHTSPLDSEFRIRIYVCKNKGHAIAVGRHPSWTRMPVESVAALIRYAYHQYRCLGGRRAAIQTYSLPLSDMVWTLLMECSAEVKEAHSASPRGYRKAPALIIYTMEKNEGFPSYRDMGAYMSVDGRDGDGVASEWRSYRGSPEPAPADTIQDDRPMRRLRESRLLRGQQMDPCYAAGAPDIQLATMVPAGDAGVAAIAPVGAAELEGSAEDDLADAEAEDSAEGLGVGSSIGEAEPPAYKDNAMPEPDLGDRATPFVPERRLGSVPMGRNRSAPSVLCGVDLSVLTGSSIMNWMLIVDRVRRGLGPVRPMILPAPAANEPACEDTPSEEPAGEWRTARATTPSSSISSAIQSRAARQSTPASTVTAFFSARSSAGASEGMSEYYSAVRQLSIGSGASTAAFGTAPSRVSTRISLEGSAGSSEYLGGSEGSSEYILADEERSVESGESMSSYETALTRVSRASSHDT